jgi:Ni,Fe-hydrogenase III large subunit
MTTPTAVRTDIEGLGELVATAISAGSRLGLITARRNPNSLPFREGLGVGSDADGFLIVVLLVEPAKSRCVLYEAPVGPGDRTFPSITRLAPQAHWFERSIYDFFGLRPVGHPRFKSVILHDVWPEGFHPLANAHPFSDVAGDGTPRHYEFMHVKGDGVYEIPVGPIHAGIIEPGHFRFSCLGEVIQNLEIRLGYLHRGIEEQIVRMPWRRVRFLVESIATDTVVGNALAHALAIEAMCDIIPPPAAILFRTIAMEIERIASHIGDLGGVCADIGYTGGAAVFGRLRGLALGLGERLTGSRFQTAYVIPGGVSHGLSEPLRAEMHREVDVLTAAFLRAKPLLMENSGALERMEGIGIVRPSLARDFGLVGPAGRASGSGYDVRQAFQQEPYHLEPLPGSTDGDVLARVRIRAVETESSLGLIGQLLAGNGGASEIATPVPDSLSPDRVGVGIVEAWRGELIHLAFTDSRGQLSRYCVKDPSFNNWTGLAIAARGQLVADFPLCNKSFGLSYSGNDL